jgi:anti-anti-sigma regulatory factor
MANRLVLPGSLDFTDRTEFMAALADVLAHATSPIEIDCSALEVVDEPIIGMLAVVTRSAQRRGLGVVLLHPTPALFDGLTRANVIDRFNTRPRHPVKRATRETAPVLHIARDEWHRGPRQTLRAG